MNIVRGCNGSLGLPRNKHYTLTKHVPRADGVLKNCGGYIMNVIVYTKTRIH